MDKELLIGRELKRMDALMKAFDAACESNGFGYHSVAAVSVLGLTRVLMQLQKQFANIPQGLDEETRKWAAGKLGMIGDIIDELAAENTFRAIMESAAISGSETLAEFSIAVISHLQQRGWIVLQGGDDLLRLPGVTGERGQPTSGSTDG